MTVAPDGLDGSSRPRRPLRIALYSGILVRHDAISASLRLKLDLLESWQRSGAPIEAVAFVQHADLRRGSLVVVPTAARAAAHAGFASADLHIFEFGIHYDLFDLVFMTPSKARRLAVYHNITPIELVETPAVRVAVQRSLQQKANLDVVDHVACVSEFNRDDLLDFGLEPGRLSVLHLPTFTPRKLPKVRRRGDRVELIFVGRFVPSKGVVDLLRAVERIRASGHCQFRVTFAGNQSFSDPTVVAAVTAAAADSSGTVRFVGEPDDERLSDMMLEADVLVIPSYHEGYCLPVVEAYAHGCQITTYDAGNLPNVVGRLGLLVPAGDVDALADALELQITAIRSARGGQPQIVPTADGDLPVETWRQRVTEHLSAYSAEAYEDSFRQLVIEQAQLVPGLPAGLVDDLADQSAGRP